MIVLISVAVVLVVLLVGALLALAFSGFGKSVQQNELAVVATGRNKASRFNPAMTMGFDIAYEEDGATQVKDARLLAAKQAAAMPRGANANIGSLGNPTFVASSKALESDPWTASKIAQYHGWDGAKSGFVRGGTAVPVAAGVAAVTIAPPVLIELTDDMDPAAKRTARIANSKAKSAYNKALKAAGVDSNAAVAAPVAGAVAAAPVAANPAAAAGIASPVLIELTDDMDPADKRAARIANSKANAAYKKALKAAGIDPNAAAPAPVAVPTAPVAAAAPVTNPAAAGIAPPELIELTDDMDPADKRAARIANSKANSAYKKALKAAGG
jgi:hypothetical protein